MHYYRARKQLNLAIYTDYAHRHRIGNACYVGYERELTDPEIEERDLVVVGEMTNEEFMLEYGNIKEVSLRGMA